MIVFKVLFVLALLLPVALLLYFLFSKMTEELGDIKANNESQSTESNLEKRRKTKNSSTIKKRPIAKSNDRRVRREAREARKEIKSDKTPRKKQKRKKRSIEDNRAQVKTKANTSYPQDPYADFKRPDFDAFISDANRKDRQR